MSSPSPIALFIGSKGGVGTTTLCREITRLAKERGNVALVDADLTGRRSIGVLLEVVRNLDSARVTSPISSIRADGITVVELAERYNAAFALDEGAVEGFAAGMTGFDLIVVDAPQPFASAVRAFVARARGLYVVVEPTLLGVAGAQTLIADLERFGVPSNRIFAVTNTRTEADAIPRSEIEDALGKVTAEIPAVTNRNYAKNMSGLLRHILSLPAGDPIASLQPSTRAPLGERRAPRGTHALAGNGRSQAPRTVNPLDAQRDALKHQVHQALLRQVDLVTASTAHTDAGKLADLRAKVESITADFITEHHLDVSAEDMASLRQEIVNEALGLGPLEDLIQDPGITEIMVNGPENVYVERDGLLEKTAKRFSEDRQLRLIIERIIAPLGRRIDESSPMVDARLPDGSRVNAIIEPLAIDGATLTIRRFGHTRLTIDDLVRIGAAPKPVFEFLEACVVSRLNCLVSGGTGSGKTTFLNILSSFLPDRERIITIEDAAELLLNKPHIVRLESRPPNVEGTGEIRIRDLLRNSLRMRPDRIIIGECRGAEALDMLQAMNTGHDGSLTTIHANSPRDAISRVETMVLMAGFDLPVRAIREQISSALDIIIHTSRMRDGSRKVLSISEVVGMEGDIVTMQEIVKFAQRGVDENNKVVGAFCYTGIQPMCLRRFEEYGINYDTRGLSQLELASSAW